jgi:uncharacterized phage protein (TIGR01671 family)
MRQIKFRVWIESVKKWIDDGKPFTPYNCILNSFSEDDLIFQQFTGLWDKSGKEIYEGDILRVNYRDQIEEYNEHGEFTGWSEEEYDNYYLYEVVWHNGEFTVNCDEYTILINGWACKITYNSCKNSSINNRVLNKQIYPIGLEFVEENCGAFGLEAKHFSIVGNVFENSDLFL